MATEVKLEAWADKSEAAEAAVSSWFKKPGAPVKRGDLLAELIVEKVNLEVEAPIDGILLEIKAEVGQVVEPGAVLAQIGSPEEWSGIINRPTALPSSVAAKQPVASPPAPAAPGVGGGNSDIVASPVAKRLLRENGLTLAEVAAFVGDSVRRIGEEEVQRYLASRQAAAGASAAQLVPYAGLRRVIGERMSRSLREMAQLTLTSEADVTELVIRREDYRAISYTALIARAVALSLPAHPYLNASLESENIRLHSQLNLGIAVNIEDGLVVPVIREAGKLSASQLTGEINRLSDLARQGKLAVEDNTGGTFTITTLGSYDIDMFTPIINPPQVAVLGIGRIADRAGVVNGQLALRKTLWLSLSFDHRVIDGAPAAAFLKDIKDLLENPEQLFSEQ